jgi:hypothetical protein
MDASQRDCNRCAAPDAAATVNMQFRRRENGNGDLALAVSDLGPHAALLST